MPCLTRGESGAGASSSGDAASRHVYAGVVGFQAHWACGDTRWSGLPSAVRLERGAAWVRGHQAARQSAGSRLPVPPPCTAGGQRNLSGDGWRRPHQSVPSTSEKKEIGPAVTRHQPFRTCHVSDAPRGLTIICSHPHQGQESTGRSGLRKVLGSVQGHQAREERRSSAAGFGKEDSRQRTARPSHAVAARAASALLALQGTESAVLRTERARLAGFQVNESNQSTLLPDLLLVRTRRPQKDSVARVVVVYSLYPGPGAWTHGNGQVAIRKSERSDVVAPHPCAMALRFFFVGGGESNFAVEAGGTG